MTDFDCYYILCVQKSRCWSEEKWELCYKDFSVCDWKVTTSAYDIHIQNLSILSHCILCLLQHHLLAMWETLFLDDFHGINMPFQACISFCFYVKCIICISNFGQNIISICFTAAEIIPGIHSRKKAHQSDGADISHTETVSSKNSESNFKLYIIIGSVFGILLLIVLLCTLVFFRQKHNMDTCGMYINLWNIFPFDFKLCITLFILRINLFAFMFLKYSSSIKHKVCIWQIILSYQNYMLDAFHY